jgi:hypothetical protein
MRLALDNHYSTSIAEQLRASGHDSVAALERGWGLLDDESLLAACALENCALLTNSVADFAAIARNWAAQGRSHAGLIFTSDTRRPRTRATIGRYVTDLAFLFDTHPDSGSIRDHILWL